MTNSINIVGRITKDPQSRQAGEYTVVSFSVACDNKGKDKGTTFFDCQAWGKQGEFVLNYLGKGRLVYVQGQMESRKHEDKTYWTVNTNEVKGLDRHRDDDQGNASTMVHVDGKTNSTKSTNTPTVTDDYDPFGDE